MLKRNGISFLTAALLTLLIASCGKDEPLTPYVPDGEGDFKYKISGLKDTSLERTDEVRYLINVEKEAGKAEMVVLSAEDLPKGMTVSFEPVNNEMASYSTTLVIRNERVPEGTHKIKIRGASAGTGISIYFIGHHTAKQPPDDNPVLHCFVYNYIDIFIYTTGLAALARFCK